MCVEGHRLLVFLVFVAVYSVGLLSMYLAVRVHIAFQVRGKLSMAVRLLDEEYAAKAVAVEEKYAALFVAKEAERARLERRKTDPVGLQKQASLVSECRGSK